MIIIAEDSNINTAVYFHFVLILTNQAKFLLQVILKLHADNSISN